MTTMEVGKTGVIPMEANKRKYVQPKQLGIYYQAVLTRRISLSIASVGGNIREILENYINKTITGVCGPEGYIAPNSAKIMNYSAPNLKADAVIFQVNFECLICNPTEGMVVEAIVKNITKAGIRAEIKVSENMDENIQSPMVIFVSRDHHIQMEEFNHVKNDENIQVKIIGTRYKLNDKYISAIGQLVPKQSNNTITLKKKPKLVIKN